MEVGDLIWYLLMIIVLFGPWVWNYFILYTLNWNERKNLFSDSWIIFITWFVSSLVVFILCALLDARFNGYFYLVNYVTFLLLLFSINIFSISAVLKGREKKKLSIADDLRRLSIGSKLSEGISLGIGNRKILQTSVIVTFLNLAMIISLIMFIKDVNKRLEKPTQTPVYGIYD